MPPCHTYLCLCSCYYPQKVAKCFKAPCIGLLSSRKSSLSCCQMNPSSTLLLYLTLASFAEFIYILRASFHFSYHLWLNSVWQTELYIGWIRLAMTTSSSPFLFNDDRKNILTTSQLLCFHAGPEHTPLLFFMSLSEGTDFPGHLWCITILGAE